MRWLHQIQRIDAKELSPVYLGAFLVLHLVLWTLGPYLARPSLPHDTLESITWGLQWQLGYAKHPFLTAWFCAGFFSLFHQADWSIYLLAQLVVLTTFLAVWQLAKKMLPSTHALVATLILEGVLFYNINSFNLTPDTLQSPLWALLCLCFYNALTTQKLRHWLGTAFFAACCLCTKYQALVLFGPMLCFCLWDPVAKTSFKKPGIYLAIGLFFVLVSAHLLWLYQHDFITVVYAQNSSKDYTETKTLLGHLLYPLLFLVNQPLYVVGALLLLCPFYKQTKESWTLSTFQWRFLITLGFGPLGCTLLLCLINGYYFPPRWSTPYFFLIGIILVGYFKPMITEKNLKQFSNYFILFSTLLFMIRLFTLTVTPRADNDAFLPNQTMASSLARLWKERYHQPLPHIIGPSYLVSLITPYLKDNPKPLLGWKQQQSPWIKQSDLGKKGAILIWDEGFNYGWDEESRNFALLPQTMLARFPQLITLAHYTFYRLSNRQPIVIGVAILPPHPIVKESSEVKRV